MSIPTFKELARQHQIKYREQVMGVGFHDKETILDDLEAQKGLIFFDGFRINEYAQARYPHFKLQQACFANMLRSEHIPFNFFVPLTKRPEYARSVLNRFLGGSINAVTEIRIDYAPDPARTLMDKNSFDVFVEYRHSQGGYGFLGIEVKYTEREYPLMKNSKEGREINLETSVYNTLTAKLGMYRNDSLQELKTDRFRQIWRSQLLGESITQKNHPDSKYEYFTSIILYPSGNEHFKTVIPEYKALLLPGHEMSFTGITYEEFIRAGRELTEDTEFIRWLQYLEDRYIVR
jgi:hypothetical protein